MTKCNHKQRACSSCGSCPRCPSCLCKGPKRGRGRPSQASPQTQRRTAFNTAASCITHSQIVSRRVDETLGTTKDVHEETVKPLTVLLEELGMFSHEMRLLPQKNRRTLIYTDLTLKERSRLNLFLEKLCRSVLRRILPNCIEESLESFQVKGLANMDRAIIEGLKSSKPGSIERRTLRAVLCASSHSSAVHHVLSTLQDGENEYDKDNTVSKETLSDEGSDLNSPSHGVPANEKVAPSNDTSKEGTPCPCLTNTTPCIAKRCHMLQCFIDVSLPLEASGSATGHNCFLCSKPLHLYCYQRYNSITELDEESKLFCYSCSMPEQKERRASAQEFLLGKRKANDEVDDTTSGQERKRKRSGSIARIYQAGRKDWDNILCNGTLKLEKVSRARRSDEDIKISLRFLFRGENIQLLSWGTKRVRESKGGKWMDFPAVLRRATHEEIYRRYVNFCRSELPKERALSRSCFMLISRELTSGLQKRKSAVDYVLGVLCYDNLRTVREIIDAEVDCTKPKSLLIDRVNAVEEFMKFSYLEHVGGDKDALHDSQFAFEATDVSEPRKSTCDDCRLPFQVLKEVGDSVTDCSEDIRTALHECQQKLMLFMAHQQRCKNQRVRIEQAFEEVSSDVEVTKVILLVDYKMKMEPIRYREKTIEFFGKRGMSWHGTVVFFSDKDGGLSTMFLDHILDNDMKQDYVAVISMIDAALARMKRELPTVVSFILLSDNARCYQNDVLPVMIPWVAQHHSLKVEAFIHSETQQGKSLVDAHFALAMMQINRYVNTTKNDVCTPSAVIEAINWNHGIANTVAEMVRINRNFPALFKWTSADVRKSLAKLGRINEFAYEELGNRVWNVEAYALSFRESVSYKFQAYESARINTSNTTLTSGRTKNDDAENSCEEDSMMETEESSASREMLPRDASYSSALTGVTVWGDQKVRRLNKRRKKKMTRKDSAIEQTIEDQERLLD